MAASLKDFPHVKAALTYCRQVVAGKIPTCQLTKLACQRQLDDLEKGDEFPYWFDAERAEQVCRFIERLPHVKGKWARTDPATGLPNLIVLGPWQCFIVTTIFGWIDADGIRRFQSAYLEVGRKNAKSTLAAAIALYMLCEDGEPGSEVYATATSKKQSSDAVFKTARQMVIKTPALAGDIVVNTLNLAVDGSFSKFEPLPANAQNLDGLNTHCSINDELHAQRNRDLRDVIDTSTASREQPLMLDITTAGHDTAGICYEVRDYCINVLQRTYVDEAQFACIYTIDKDDDWTDRKVWLKANPNWNVSVYPMGLENKFKKAKAKPSFQTAFKTKHLSVWCSAADNWLNLLEWDACADPSLKLDDFTGRDCFNGVDLSSKIDLSAQVLGFPEYIKDELHVTVFGKYYLPEQAIMDAKNSQYDGWCRRGLLTKTDGKMIDIDQIEDDTLAWSDQFNMVEVDVDPMHNSTQYSTHMMAEGLTVVDIRPTVMNFSEAMKYVEAMVKEGRFHHDGNELLTWMMGNVAVKPDYKDNVFPRKNTAQGKIDGAICIFMLMNRILLGGDVEIQPTVVSTG